MNGRLVLAKLGGAQRIRGRIKLDANDGFTFVGEMYCPDDDCEQVLHGTFRPTGRGGFKGRFRGESLELDLAPAPADAFGGVDYGGNDFDPFDLETPIGGSMDGEQSQYEIDSRGRHRP